MTTYFVSSVDGDNADDGSTWALAKATIAGALAVATAAGDVIKVSHVHAEVLSGDTTFTVGNHVQLIVVDRSNSDALAVQDGTTGYVGHTSTSYAITFAGAYRSLWRGFYFLGSGSTAKAYSLGGTTNSHTEIEGCTLKLTASASSTIALGLSGSSLQCTVRMIDCTIVLTNTSQRAVTHYNSRTELCNVVTSGTGRFYLAQVRGGYLYAVGCDFASCSNSDFISSAQSAASVVMLQSCKLPTGVAWHNASSVNGVGVELYLFNCSDGDQHYQFAHYNAIGSTVTTPAYYADDGATAQDTTPVSHKVVTTANCSIYTPYVGPWVVKPHTGTSATTATIEGLRVDSTTIIQDDEVWGEWSYQGTSGSTRASFLNDGMTLLGTPANQTSSKAYSDWTGTPTDTDSADSTFKLVSASFTPAEAGNIAGRVVVGEASLTIYYDPQIRLS